LKKNRAEIEFLLDDKQEATMGEASDMGFGSGYGKIVEIETFCVDRVS